MSRSPDFHWFKSTEDQSLVNSAENSEEDLTLVDPGRVRSDLLIRQIETIKEGLTNSEVEEVKFSLFQSHEQTETPLSKQPTLPLLPPHIPSPCLSRHHLFSLPSCSTFFTSSECRRSLRHSILSSLLCLVSRLHHSFA